MKIKTTKETERWFRRITRPGRIGRITELGIIRRITRKENGSKTTN